jgi:hypothetical protein
MSSFFRTYGQLMLLRGEAFEHLRQSRDSMAFAMKLFLAVGLIAGVGTLSGVPQLMQTPTVSERAYSAAEQIVGWTEGLEGFAARLATEPAQSVAQWFEDLGATLASFEPPLGARTSRVVRLIGEWLTTPLTMMASWLTMILPVLLVAKWMGAGGNLRALASLALVSAAPQVLTVASSFPLIEGSPIAALATTLAFVALVWGMAILVKGLAVGGGIEQRRAVTILVVTALVFYILIPSVLLTIGGLKLWALMQLLA